MKRLIITAPRCAEFEEVMMPVCPSNGLLVRARVTAISTGTEIRVYRVVPVDAAGQYIHANIPLVYPIENGYSMVGDVIEVGEQVTGFAPGDRVFAPATHREIAAVPALDAIKLPASIPDEQAVFINILEVSHIALRKGSPTPGDTLGVIGQGVIGLAALAYGQAFGFRTLVVDKEAARLAIARRMGAALALSPDAPDFLQQVHDFTEGYGADLVLEAASTWAAIQMSMDIVSKGGKVVVVARHTDQPQFSAVGDPYLQKDITLLTSYGYPPNGQRWDRQRSFALTLDLMARGKLAIAPMITHRFPWQALPEVYHRLDQGERALVGVVIDWRK
ncbi:MAG: zinc-binding dehydrogenase [Chloroflexi bacterium]|nr:zinc-binding dehydrogenase [Chloroflexota bacterium]